MEDQREKLRRMTVRIIVANGWYGTEEAAGLAGTDEAIVVPSVPGPTGSGGSRLEKKANIDQADVEAAARRYLDYFCERPTSRQEVFERRYRLSRGLFSRVHNAVLADDTYFCDKAGLEWELPWDSDRDERLTPSKNNTAPETRESTDNN